MALTELSSVRTANGEAAKHRLKDIQVLRARHLFGRVTGTGGGTMLFEERNGKPYSI